MDQLSKQVEEWMPKSEILLPFYQGISTFLEKNLDSDKYTEEDVKPKIIADPLLGYIFLNPLEVAIIDTPLFQRLRKIRQLGLAFLVFPSLNYSRFEHSIGVVGRLNQLLHKLIENDTQKHTDSTLQSIINKHIDSVRLAALMHDIGHCIFSHCSERVINRLDGTSDYPSGIKIREEFSSHFEKDRLIPFAELFTVAIMGNKVFHNFINKLNLFKTKDITKILENSCRFILGLPVKDESRTVFLAQLISSGIDADKIDYMMREQHYTGIKLEIDLDRILSKLNVFNLKSSELPVNLGYLKRFFTPDENFKVLGFSKSGQFVFEEFCIARLALHVKVYLHQKVRAAESQLSHYLEIISKNETVSREFFLQKAHNWLNLSESIIENPHSINLHIKDEGLFVTSFLKDDQEMMLKKIDLRNLFYRAFAFGQINSFSEGVTTDEGIDKKIENFFELFRKEGKNDDEVDTELENQIIDEAKSILKVMDNEINGKSINDKDLDKLIVDIPRLRFKSIQQGQESLYFARPPLSPLKWTIPLDKIVIYFEENRALGYVFSEKPIAELIGIASEKVIFIRTGKVFNQESNISKDTYIKMISLKRDLTQKGFYKKIPELKDISDYLKKANAAEHIKVIHEKLSGFESLKKERITINRITTFVNQFPIELQEACLEFIKLIEVYDERLLEAQVSKVIENHGRDHKIGISHLGGISDSGGRLSYNLREILQQHRLEAKEISDSLIKQSELLIIYDDNINSGLQVLNIMAELLEELENLPPELNLGEHHISPLATEEAKSKLKRMPLHFCYIVGCEGTENKIKSDLENYLSFKQENINVHIHTVLKKSEKIFNGSDSKFNHSKKLELKEFMVRIGEQLLKNEGKSPEKIEKCRLGYAEAEAMVLFPYNIPTMTVTALWCRGIIEDGVPWIPLAERRRRSVDGKFIAED